MSILSFPVSNRKSIGEYISRGQVSWTSGPSSINWFPVYHVDFSIIDWKDIIFKLFSMKKRHLIHVIDLKFPYVEH